MIVALSILNVVQSGIIGVLLLRKAELFEEQKPNEPSVALTLDSDTIGLV